MRKPCPAVRFFCRLAAVLLCLTILPASAFMAPVTAASSLPAVSAECAVLIDADSGRVIWEKNANVQHAMASTTKIMTALVALRTTELERIVEVSASAVGIEGSSVYLYPGERLSMEALLYAMLLESANDAAAAIAIEIAGSTEAFAELMNACAAELGLNDTHFTNPHGLWDEQHYTTARELAVIARAALNNESFRTIVSTYKKTIPLNETEGVRLLINHNKLIKLYDGAIGVKTGYTKKSGRCLVSAAERDGVTLIAVTLNAPDDWKDHTQMLDYGFSVSARYMFGGAGELSYTLPVIGGTLEYVSCFNLDALAVTLPADTPAPQLCVELPRMLYAPIEAGEVLGQLKLVAAGRTVASTPIVAAFGVDAKSTGHGFWSWLRGLFARG